jgi:hypothetical protein
LPPAPGVLEGDVLGMQRCGHVPQVGAEGRELEGMHPLPNQRDWFKFLMELVGQLNGRR